MTEISPSQPQRKTTSQTHQAWNELWRELSHRSDGTIRPLPDATEGMIVRLKKLDDSGNAEHASECRHTLQQFHADILLLESSAPYRAALESNQDQLCSTWFSFRRSAHTWADLLTTLRTAEEPHALIPLVAHELWENREQYMSDLTSVYSPHALTDARRVLSYLSNSFHLVAKDEANIIPEASTILYGAGCIDEIDYVNRLSSYTKMAGRSLHECITQLAKASKVLPNELQIEAETELVKLGAVIGTVLKHENIADCMRLLDAPSGVLAGMAPALIQRLGSDLNNPEASSAFETLTFLLRPSSLLLHPSTLAHVAPAIVSEMISVLETLPPHHAITILDRIAPLITHMEWFNRNASLLARTISHEDHSEIFPLRSALLKCVLISPNMTNDLITWCSHQLGFRSCAPRLEAVARLLADVLKQRQESGALAVSDPLCITALRVLSAIGPSNKLALKEVGALTGIPIATLWKFGPIVLPYSVRKDENPSVVEAARHTLLTISSGLRKGFLTSVLRRNI